MRERYTVLTKHVRADSRWYPTGSFFDSVGAALYHARGMNRDFLKSGWKYKAMKYLGRKKYEGIAASLLEGKDER